MTAEAPTSDRFSAGRPAAVQSRRRLSIGFLNWAHALDHFVILIYPTVVIELQITYGRSYSSSSRFRPLRSSPSACSRCRRAGLPIAGAAAT
jgi:hypothetical protein